MVMWPPYIEVDVAIGFVDDDECMQGSELLYRELLLFHLQVRN